MVEAISYELLFDLLRRERNNDDIQKLEPTFYASVLSYMAEKKQVLDSSGTHEHGMGTTAEAERARIQFQNIKKILRELYDRREKKISILALNSVRTGSSIIDASKLLPEEQLFFNELQTFFSRYRRDVLEQVLRQSAPFGGATITPPTPTPTTKVEEKRPEQPKQEEKPAPKPTSSPPTGITTIRMVKSLPRFSAGEKAFGPYNTGEEIELPSAIAEKLIKAGRAQAL